MSESSDTTFVDTPTLIQSLRRDLGEISKRLRESDAFAREALATLWEIERRHNDGSSAVAWAYWTDPDNGEEATEDGDPVRKAVFDRHWVPRGRKAEPLYAIPAAAHSLAGYGGAADVNKTPTTQEPT